MNKYTLLIFFVCCTTNAAPLTVAETTTDSNSPHPGNTPIYTPFIQSELPTSTNIPNDTTKDVTLETDSMKSPDTPQQEKAPILRSTQIPNKQLATQPDDRVQQADTIQQGDDTEEKPRHINRRFINLFEDKPIEEKKNIPTSTYSYTNDTNQAKNSEQTSSTEKESHPKEQSTMTLKQSHPIVKKRSKPLNSDPKIKNCKNGAMVSIENESPYYMKFEDLDSRKAYTIEPGSESDFCIASGASVDGYVLGNDGKILHRSPVRQLMWFTKRYLIEIDEEGQMDFELETDID